MEKVEKTLDVNVPVHTAYNQWTQFEEFPHFMDGVELVKQLDDKHLLWRAKVGGKDEEWQADITEQIPDQRIAWHSTTGAKNAGLVTFHPQGSNRTRITLRLDYDPEGIAENVGDKMGFMSRQVEEDLVNFKKFIEERGAPTGEWRGEIHGQRVEHGPRQ